MKKLNVAGAIAIGLLLLGINTPKEDETTNVENVSNIENVQVEAKKAIPLCDGKAVIENCTSEGQNYKQYVLHDATPEKSHVETETSYVNEVRSYCTLCNDGTYSPSCATGRGACSHHGGVAQWDAPVYGKVAVENHKTVIDQPAKESYFVKVLE